MFLGIVLSFLLINTEALILPNNLLINNEYNITWTPSQFTSSNVSLTLMYSLQTNLPAVYSNGTNILDISITNNGNYGWQVNDELNYEPIDGIYYKIKLMDSLTTLLSNEFQFTKNSLHTNIFS